MCRKHVYIDLVLWKDQKTRLIEVHLRKKEVIFHHKKIAKKIVTQLKT